MNVFLVEDSALLRERLTRMVSAVPQTRVVGFAASSKEALEKIPRAKPDVVILDIRLTQGTGYQVLQELKRRENRPAVIVLTNYAYPPYREKYLRGGADYFFDKSTEFDLFLRALQQLHYRFDSHAKGRSFLTYML